VTALASTGTYAGAEKQAQHGAWSMEHGGDAQAQDQQIERLTDQETKRPKDEKTGTLRVETVRVPKWMPRALAWLWFTWQARKRIPRMDWDVCVLMTDPPLLPLLAARLKDQETKRRKDEGAKAAERLRDCGTAESARRVAMQPTDTGPHDATRRVAVWLMDLYPEALVASGRLSETNPIYRWCFNKRQRALWASDLLLFLGEAQKALVEKCEGGKVERCEVVGGQKADGTRQIRTMVVPPWDDRGNIALATEESLRNLALYAGNLGEAHCFEEILAAAPHLPGDWTIRFAARGAKLSALKEKASELKRPRDEETKRPGATVEVTGYASEEETPGLLASARVHLITMSPGWEGIVVPSKLYGCIRTGRPMLFIGPENADTAREVRAHDWGKVLPPGAGGEEVAAAILELAARPTRATQSENGGRAIAKLLEILATE
jgi:hypothetical protein